MPIDDRTARQTPIRLPTFPLPRNTRPSPAGFELLGELGRGGMGVVYKARQTALNRLVALKMVLGGHYANDADRIRFMGEAEAVASVKHPNVVQVYEFGYSDGQPYFAMEYLDGGSLARQLGEFGRMHASAAAHLVERIARGVQAAHDVGLIHRDLKPANILLSGVRSPESGVRPPHSRTGPSLTPDSGLLTPKVTDFGLAKHVARADMTQTGVVIGTPAYMAPEQATGQGKFVGPAADVYALGAILYECLSGRPPFTADDSGAILARVVNDDAPPVRQFAPDVPPDLELICLKCLAKLPAERYRSAAALADDLTRFLVGEPVEVRPAGQLEKAVKWVRRYPTRAIAYGLTLLTAASIGLTAGTIKLLREGKAAKQYALDARDVALAERGEANAAKVRAEVAEKQLKVEASHRAVEVANRAFEGLDVARVRDSLAECRADLRSWGWHYLDRAVSREVRVTPTGDRNTLTVAVAPDGRVVTSGDGGVRAWDADGGAARTIHPHPHSRVGFSRDGRRFFANNMTSRATVFDTATWAEVRGFSANVVGWFSLCPTGDRVFTGSVGTAGQVCDATTGEKLWDVPSGPLVGLCGAFGPDGETVAVGGMMPRGHAVAGGAVQIWPISGPAPPRTFGPHGSRVHRLTYGEDGSLLATIADDRSVKVWRVATGQEVLYLPANTVEVLSVAISPDNARLATASDDRVVRVWDLRNGTELFTFRGHTGGVEDVAFTPDGRRVVSVGVDAAMREWDVSGRPDRVGLTIPSNRILTLPRAPVLLPGGRVFVGGDVRGGCYDVRTGAADAHLNPPAPEKVRWAALVAGDTRLDAVLANGDVWQWDVKTGRGARVREGVGLATPVPPNVYAAAADLSRLLVRSLNEVRVIDGATGATVCTLAPHAGGLPQASALSTDGKWAATGGNDRQAHVWDATTGRPAFQLRCLGNMLRAVAFSPDGARIATASGDGWVQVWDVATRRELLTVRCRQVGAETWALGFSADGATLVVINSLGTACYLGATPR